MSFNLNEFRSTILRPARPTLFEVTVGIVGVTEDLRFKCEATSVPGNKIGKYPIFFNGRSVNYAGDRQFDDWSVQIIQTEDSDAYDQFIRWFNLANGTTTGLRSPVFEDALSYKGWAEITQKTQTGEDFAKFKMEGVFPSVLGAIDLSWRDVDKYSTFNVTFAYDWFDKA